MKHFISVISTIIVFLIISLSGYGGVLGVCQLLKILANVRIDFILLSIIYWTAILLLVIFAICWVVFTEDDDEEF